MASVWKLLKIDERKRANSLETNGQCESVQRWELIQSMMLTQCLCAWKRWDWIKSPMIGKIIPDEIETQIWDGANISDEW